MNAEDQRKATEQERREIRRAAEAMEGPRLVREDENGVRCLFCPGTGFRRSKLRGGDFKQILLLHYPVRCLRCSQRQYASFPIAGLSIPASIRHQRAPRPQETWKSWTGDSKDPSVKKLHPPSYAPYTNKRLSDLVAEKDSQSKGKPAQPSDDDAIW